MLHVTCDLCSKEITPPVDAHFVVKMEVYAAFDPSEVTDADLDEDHLEAIAKMLCEEEEVVDPDHAAPRYKKFRFDLCAECHRKFIRDPLIRETEKKLNFSEN
ncbi:MAG: hypothetical protein KatS3mg105_1815 [Gemmatales bacterium]|nr:MAG: hypothetical protein KatS3mg105_1815 [Gemmatales bacterium]